MKIVSVQAYRTDASALGAEVRAVSGLRKDDGAVVKLVVRVTEPSVKAKLKANDLRLKDAFNVAEPYDRNTHVFYFKAADYAPGKARLFWRVPALHLPRFASLSLPGELLPLPDAASGWTRESEEKEILAEGLTYEKLTMKNRDGAPVIVSILTAERGKVSLRVGTANDGYQARRARATIPEMIAAAEKSGRRVLAAVNADFFDIFGDFHPSGLCVKDGKTVANGSSLRPFVGMTKDGGFLVSDLEERPDVLPSLREAAGGMQRLLKDGEVFDLAPGEPFGFTPHPRTAAGVTKDGRLLLLEVDGRIPDHSNGATLTDLALFLKSRGAVDALNLDGGGSSAVYTRGEDGLPALRTVPADLFRPFDKLIRKDYNALLLTERDP